MQQKVQQKVHNDYAAPLIKRLQGHSHWGKKKYEME